MFKKVLILSAITSIASFSVMADESPLSYTYAGIGYMDGDIADVDFTGYGIYGSSALNNNFFLLGGYSIIESDDQFLVGSSADEIEAKGFSFGVGFHTPISPTVDFVSSLSYADTEVGSADVSEDGNGYVLAAGVRAMPTEVLELGAFIDYSDIEDDSETGYEFSARYFTTPDVSVGLAFGSSDDFDALSLDIRFDL